MYEIKEIESFIKTRLSAKRFNHSKGVAEGAKKLASHYKINEDDAYVAGLLHDCAKELSLEEMNFHAKKFDLVPMVRESKNLLHGPAGAVLARKYFDISDEIFDACFYHTVGKKNMSLLTKLVFLADITEESRNFKGVDEIRELCYKNVDEAIILSIDLTINRLIEKGEKIYTGTVNARNFLLSNR